MEFVTITAAERPRPPLSILATDDLRSILLGGMGLVVFGLAPMPLIGLGLAMYGAAVFLRPWILTPLVVLTLPFYLHPRALGGQEIAVTEIAILVGAIAVLSRGSIER